MITLKDYFRGRDITYAKDLTPEILANAIETVEKVNSFLELFYLANPNAATRTVNSGWRPPTVNSGTKGAAPKSNHLLALAEDVSDDDEALDQWCLTPEGLKKLDKSGLWLEHPESTPRWCHLQTVPPKSGNRVFKIR